jgi:hypothetical protein
MGDNPILVMSSIVCLLSILANYRYSKRFTIINIIIFAGYSTWLYYGFFAWTVWGDKLGSFIFLLLLSSIQFIINAGYFVYRFVVSKRNQ